MDMTREGNTCNPTLDVKASSLFKNGTLVVSLLGIFEVLSPTLGSPHLDIFNRDVEWMVQKRKNRRGNKAVVRSTKRVGHPLTRIIYQKET